jgi:quinol monooxygenase YgiN
MIKRIVKLNFRLDAVDTFVQEVFEPSKHQIRRFPGCLHMELLRGIETPNILFTFSIWESEAALEQYRQSELFQATWAKTKALFAEKAEAWSVDLVDG